MGSEERASEREGKREKGRFSAVEDLLGARIVCGAHERGRAREKRTRQKQNGVNERDKNKEQEWLAAGDPFRTPEPHPSSSCHHWTVVSIRRTQRGASQARIKYVPELEVLGALQRQLLLGLA